MAQALIDNAGPASLLTGPSQRKRSREDQPVTATLVIENMHCGGCLKKVEAALASVPGVQHARANLSTHRANVTLAADGPEVSQLVEALQRAGFKAAELAGTESPDLAAADRDYLKRLAVAGFAAANIMLLSVSVWSGANGDMPASLQGLFHWLSALIALPATAYAGQPFFRSAFTALKARRVNMDVPISLGVTLATGMSVYQTIRGSEQVYFDAAVTLLFFLLIGRALDMRMRVRSAGAAANLLGLRAQSALVVAEDGTTTRMLARALEPGMRVVTAAGERFAADGRIVSGATEIDESLITGETRPRNAIAGEQVFAGTLNLGQPITIETTAADERTLIAEIARLMQAAEQGRASYVRLADRAARLYAPAVHALGLSTFLGWMALGSGWEPALTAAIAVLIITCPCALALAVPAVQVAATSRLFAQGVLVKAPDALERLAEIDTVVLDKTGTLTRGEPVLKGDRAIDPETLARAAAMAIASRHPYAKAVVRAALARGLAVKPAEDVSETSGFGLSKVSDEGEERLGSGRWCGVEQGGEASLWYRRGQAAPVPFEMTDTPRDDAAAVVAALKSAGLSVEILSGDQPAEVERIARAVGIEHYAAGLMPAQKLARLAALKAQGRKPMMIGDGLNDAPSLAAAHASLSPSSAADISQTAADAVFQGEALMPVLDTIAVARSSRRMALENFAIALGYNVIFVPLAVAGIVTPLIAAIAMSGSSIAVTVNALRLRTRRLRLGSWSTGR
jgi:Cu2+-exporting ATPase